MLFEAGQRVRVHEFHYWDTTDNGSDFFAKKPVSGRNWYGGIQKPTLYAGFGHLYLAAQPETAERFVTAMKNYVTVAELISRKC